MKTKFCLDLLYNLSNRRDSFKIYLNIQYLHINKWGQDKLLSHIKYLTN